jgi:protein ImuB
VILCVQFPRFELTVVAGGPAALTGRALALAPAGASSQLIGEVSGTAQAAGVRAGMRLGEALARCPELVLIPEDPVGVAEVWERAVCALEAVGAAVEAAAPGVAYFSADGLLGLHDGLQGLLAATRRALGRSARIGGGPTRFCALAAAGQARPRRARVIEEREARRYLAGQPVTILGSRPQTAALVTPLEQLGVGTLGELVALGAAAVSDRFGRAGTLARGLALGQDDPLRPRRPEERLAVSMPVGEANSTTALERVLAVLVDRLLAARQRRGRTIRALMLSARLVERGTWREPVVLREPTADGTRLRLALSPRLVQLPAPAESLGVAVSEWGPAEGDQQSLLDGERRARLARLQSAVEQTRVAAGPYAVLRTLEVDPDSRVPERRYTYTPYLR